MKSGSWSSWQAALPQEARAGGERDDEPSGEACPSHLDGEGRQLWQMCDWIINGGATSPEIPLQLQALAIRRELRIESELMGVREINTDLLAALEDMVAGYEDTMKRYGHGAGDVNAAKAAISKARNGV